MILTSQYIDSPIIEQGFSRFVEMAKDNSKLDGDLWNPDKKFDVNSLWDIKKENKDRAGDDACRYRLNSWEYEENMESVAKKFLVEQNIITEDQRITRSGGAVYYPGGYMGWHTNRCRPGIRCYFNWASESGKSGLKYWYEGTEEIIRDCVDQVGWQLRMFSTDYPKPFWHSVWSECIRLSIGFRILGEDDE